MRDGTLAFWFILLFPNITLIGLFMVLSFKVRTLTENFNESRYIAMALWNFMFIIVTMTGVGSSNLHPDTDLLFRSACLCVMCLSTTLILFLPKVFTVMTWNSKVAPVNTLMTGEVITYESENAADFSKENPSNWINSLPHSPKGRIRAKADLSPVGKSTAIAPTNSEGIRTISVNVVSGTPLLLPPLSMSPRAAVAVQAQRSTVAAPQGSLSPVIGAVVTNIGNQVTQPSRQTLHVPAPADGNASALAQPRFQQAAVTSDGPLHQPTTSAPQAIRSYQLPVLKPMPPVRPRPVATDQRNPGRDAERRVPADSERLSAAIMCMPLLAPSEPASPASPMMPIREQPE